MLQSIIYYISNKDSRFALKQIYFIYFFIKINIASKHNLLYFHKEVDFMLEANLLLYWKYSFMFKSTSLLEYNLCLKQIVFLYWKANLLLYCRFMLQA